MNSLRDKYNRVIDYIRISITDRCNLRCVYCMPPEGVGAIEHREILTYEEILRVVRIASDLGVRKVRITGGEPLSRKNITFLTSSIKKINGIEDLSLTTNGVLLENLADHLSESGVDRVNISLDSMRPERFRTITRGGDLDLILRGIEKARNAGLMPVKINMIPMRGINDDEIVDFARITLNKGYHVRFIEFMPYGHHGFWSPEKYIPCDEIRSIAETLGPLTPVKARKNGPSKYFRFEKAEGVIGFISAITHHFCEDCNRLRLTSDGKLKPCLFSETEIDLKPALRESNDDREIERLLRLAIEIKPKGHTLDGRCGTKLPRSMSQVGG